MGYGLSIYCAPPEQLQRIVGSRDEALMNEVLSEMADWLTDYDRQMGAPDTDPDADPDISHADAVREIFTGDFTNVPRTSRYGWAMEVILAFFGERLSYDGFIPVDTEWYQTLDETLDEHGVADVRFTKLIWQSPFKIPEPDDWPCIGHWTESDIAAAAEAMPRVLAKVEDDIHTAFATALGWCEQARKQPGHMLVGFHG